MQRVVPVIIFSGCLLMAHKPISAAVVSHHARISPARARAIAAKKLHGRSVSSKYEFEDGRWQYAVIVSNGKQWYEVEVDPNSGKVLDTEKTTPAEEARESAADRAAAAQQSHRPRSGGQHRVGRRAL